MKIIGAGLGRTGTSSLKAALEMLGFGPCYHMQEINKHPEHIPIWLDAVAGKPVDWVTFLQPYQAMLDWPACDHYATLMATYPEAKVLLSVRDPEKWYDSVHETIYTFNKTFPEWAMSVATIVLKIARMPSTFFNSTIKGSNNLFLQAASWSMR